MRVEAHHSLVALLLLAFVLHAQAGIQTGSADSESGSPPVQNEVSEFPVFPTQTNLRQIYVSAVATNAYFVDSASLSVTRDSVVRYVLVVQAAGGARSVTYEGIHCEDRKWRLYATGRSDGSWVPARTGEWREIENKPVNGHHVALSRDYFCPFGNAIFDAEEGRRALRLGKHPSVNF